MTENITVFKHNSIKIDAEVGAVYVDPFEMDEAPHDATFVLITHDHYDHFSVKDIEKVVNKNTVLVVPRKMVEKAREVESLVAKIETVKPEISKNIDGLELETVPMYNIMKPFHPKVAEWVGYIVTVAGSRIYIAGDIDAIKEAKEVKCDVALVPVGGFYTMDAKKAAGLINTMKPKVAIPVHYGNLVGTAKDGEEFAKHVKEPTKVELKIK
ncbi:L-ascorbate metabolism protein UlaG, beta-lactamase superfamily [Lachnospiraceae bacterium YSD2013]|nr:L-ascorbate metabolism protein UlaG, beta-lactamase superfamily [Lachnospiraceae bacterium YSD2013]